MRVEMPPTHYDMEIEGGASVANPLHLKVLQFHW